MKAFKKKLFPGNSLVTVAPWYKTLSQELINHQKSNPKYQQVLALDFLYIAYNQNSVIPPLGNISAENNKADRNSDSYILLINLKYVSS